MPGHFSPPSYMTSPTQNIYEKATIMELFIMLGNIVLFCNLQRFGE
jgi:hypothetical protein